MYSPILSFKFFVFWKFASMTRVRRNASEPVAPGDGPAPSAAGHRASRSAIPPAPLATPNDNPARPAPPSPAAPAQLQNAPLARDASPAGRADNTRQDAAGGAGNGGLDDDDRSQDPILRPDEITASRREGDNANRQMGGQALVEGFDKNAVSFRVH